MVQETYRITVRNSRMMRKVLPGILLLIFTAISANVFAAADTARNIPVTHDELYGSIRILIPPDEFRAQGFAYGDSVNITFSNGYSIQDLPFYNGYYVRPGETVLCGVDGKDNMVLSINYGDDIWGAGGLSEGDTADISLCEAGKYLDVQNANDIYYSDDRSAYSSDEVFANFRSMKGGSLKNEFLFRSASPCNNKNGRAMYADRLIRDAGVLFALNLADDADDISEYAESDDFDSPYYLSLYEDGRVSLTPISY
ncbi:MAG: hypothetical protein Q4G47_06495, partial [Lachnospiraceae bacterium]|nr:hypothetical protein [Lachnospiraceae bacterium]